ncbi:MAG: hypothetical protein QM765_49345 [Myxococcales bacterium]
MDPTGTLVWSKTGANNLISSFGFALGDRTVYVQDGLSLMAIGP